MSRIIEIDINSATLSSKKKGKFYVEIFVKEGQELKTKLSIPCSEKKNNSSTSAAWNQKFVFSVPKKFIFEEGSTVSFTVVESHKYLSNSAIGMATAEMGLLFPIQRYFKKDDDGDDDEKNTAAKYDKDGDDDEGAEEQQPIKEAAFELKAQVGLPILKGSSQIGTLNISIIAWERYEVIYLGSSKKSLPISKGSERLGNLITEKTTEEKYVNVVGNAKWENLAMEFEEFMMEKVTENIKPKSSKMSSLEIMLCFANKSKDVRD